jgi:hypothetical protein
MRLLLIILLYSSFSCAQYSCMSSVTSDLPSCDYLNNTYTQCNNLTGNALNNCVCTPQLLFSIFELVSSDSLRLRSEAIDMNS